MLSSSSTVIPPITAATDAAAVARLRALPAIEAEALVCALLGIKTAADRQDHLIGSYRIALSLPALDGWIAEAKHAKDERRFTAYLAEIRRAAERADAFREVLARSEQLHQVNVLLLAARLFDALVARDQPAIEQLAHSFAEVFQASKAHADFYLQKYPYDPSQH